jgi:hypothetical protein
MNSLNTHHLKLKYYFNMQKGKLVKGYTLVNVFLATPATLLKNSVSNATTILQIVSHI